MNEQVDKVRRMAERMELAASTVIEPVLCLAEEHAADFGEPQVIRGVFVVPVDRLASWLTSRPRPAVGEDLQSRAVRIAASFPSATQPAFLAVPPRRARGTVVAGRRVATPARPPASAGRAGRRVSPRRKSALKPLLAVAAVLVMISPVGTRLIIAGSNGAGTLLAHRMVSALPAAAEPWTSPCTGVTDAQVATAAGHPVSRYQNGTEDTCTWRYRSRPTGPAIGTVTIATDLDTRG